MYRILGSQKTISLRKLVYEVKAAWIYSQKNYRDAVKARIKYLEKDFLL